MSLDQLKASLQHTLNRVIRQENTLALCHPIRLQMRLKAIEEKFEHQENTAPPSNRVLSAIIKLEKQGPTELTRRDWKNIAWGLSLKIEGRPKKLINCNEMGSIALNSLEDLIKQSVPTNLFRALLFSYFALEPEEKDQNPDNFQKLRGILRQHLATFNSEQTTQRTWLETLKNNTYLLQDNPTLPLSNDFLQGHNHHAHRVCAALEVPKESWFWRDLISETLTRFVNLNDDAFRATIDSILLMGKENAHYQPEILRRTLDRYATSRMKSETHESLKSLSIDQWGSPDLHSSTGWSLVKPETKSMVIQWIVKADLEAFFTLIDHSGDKARYKYWLRFISQISETYFILGSNFYESNAHGPAEFKKRNKGRYSKLTGNSANNNAFIMKIRNYYIVEFSQKPNACYIYNSMPTKIRAREVDINQLKSNSNIGRIIHNGNWQRNSDIQLRDIGIFPDNTSYYHY